MFTRGRLDRLPLLTVVLGLLISAAPLRACQIPVFRYALERWPAAPYEATVFHRRPLDSVQQAQVNALRGAAHAPANLAVSTINVDGKPSADDQAAWAAAQAESERSGGGAPRLPWLVLRLPDASRAMWSGPLRDAPPAMLLDSPARRAVRAELLRGQSVVWLLVETGDAQRDAPALRRMQEDLPRLEKSIVMPEMDPTVPEARLLSPVPLRVGFSLVRVSRTDPAERFFVEMLLHALKPSDRDAPVVVPVFGQGRALCTFVGDDIESKGLDDAAQFLAGACSCQVKELNPGFDLLMSGDWAADLHLASDVGDWATDPARPAPTTGPATRAAGVAAASSQSGEPADVAGARLVSNPSTGTAASTGDYVIVHHQVFPQRQPRSNRLLGAIAVAGAVAIIFALMALRSRRRDARGGRQ